MAFRIRWYLPGEAVRAIIPYDENPPASNFIPSFPASTSTFPWGRKKNQTITNYELLYSYLSYKRVLHLHKQIFCFFDLKELLKYPM